MSVKGWAITMEIGAAAGADHLQVIQTESEKHHDGQKEKHKKASTAAAYSFHALVPPMDRKMG